MHFHLLKTSACTKSRSAGEEAITLCQHVLTVAPQLAWERFESGSRHKTGYSVHILCSRAKEEEERKVSNQNQVHHLSRSTNMRRTHTQTHRMPGIQLQVAFTPPFLTPLTLEVRIQELHPAPQTHAFTSLHLRP